jgi:hypothetical protein
MRTASIIAAAWGVVGLQRKQAGLNFAVRGEPFERFRAELRPSLEQFFDAGNLHARLRVGARRCADNAALARCGNERPIVGTIHGGQ